MIRSLSIFNWMITTKERIAKRFQHQANFTRRTKIRREWIISQAIVELSQADLISVDELMDSPPELTLIRNSETNEDWLNNEVKKTEEDMSDDDLPEEWDFEAPTELIQIVQDENITTGDRFFEELESQDKSPLGKTDEQTNEAMDDFFGD